MSDVQFGSEEWNKSVRRWWFFQNKQTPTSISLTPSTFNVGQGSTFQLTGYIRDQHGNVISGQGPTYVSGTPSVATVSHEGLVTGVASSGSTVITASYAGLTSQTSTGTISGSSVATSISLSPSTFNVSIGGTFQLTGEILDQNSNVMAGLSPTYTSGTPANMTVNSSTGLVTGVAHSGTSVITASYSGLTSATSTGTATYTPVATSVSLTPSSFTITLAGTYQLTGAVLDQYGAAISGDVPTYSSSNTGVMTVNTSALVTSVTSGSATITAAYGGLASATSAGSTGTTVALRGTTTVASGVSVAAATGVTVTKPTGVVSGDLLAAMWWGHSGATFTPPTGWTTALQTTINEAEVLVSWLIAGGSEPSSYTFKQNVDDDLMVQLQAFQTGTFNATTPLASATSTSFNSATYTAPSVTTTINGSIFVCVYSNQDNDAGVATAPSGLTLLADSKLSDGEEQASYYGTQTTAGATGTHALVWTTSGNGGAYTFVVNA